MGNLAKYILGLKAPIGGFGGRNNNNNNNKIKINKINLS